MAQTAGTPEPRYREPDYVTVTAFNYTFEDVDPETANELKTLDDEGAIYSEFADHDEDGKFLGTFSRYRIAFTVSEGVEFVQAMRAAQEFNQAMRKTKDLTAAVLAVSEERFRERVASYAKYGKAKDARGEILDNRGCLASFLPSELEDLICGHRPDRYEPAPLLGSASSRSELVVTALRSVAVSARKLADRGNGRPGLEVINEYDVQDLAETALRALFTDVVREDPAPKNAGSSKRIDLTIPSASIVIECKYVRDARHATKIADELKIDFESYHEHPACQSLFVYIYDPCNYISDPVAFAESLHGLRQKRNHTFSVRVLIN
jgi:REase_DpnII-MboI